MGTIVSSTLLLAVVSVLSLRHYRLVFRRRPRAVEGGEAS
jgi:hypothetical protein